MPESMTATRTGGRSGSASQKSYARIGRQVPLLLDERVVRHVREPPGVEPLDVGRAGKVAQAGRASARSTTTRGERREALRAGPERPTQRGQVGDRRAAPTA